MNANCRISALSLLLLLLAGPGCVTTSAPGAWTDAPPAMASTTYGSWVDVRHGDAAAADTTRGELIAATTTEVFVLTPDSSFQQIPRLTIIDLELTAYDANWGYLATWTTLGTLSTLSHGFVAVLSLPIWLIAGSAAASTQSRRPIFTNPSLEVLQRFARFPQGIPPDLDRNQLQPKPSGE